MGTDNLKPLSKAERERRWLVKSREAIDAYNRRVAQHGLLSDEASLQIDQVRRETNSASF